MLKFLKYGFIFAVFSAVVYIVVGAASMIMKEEFLADDLPEGFNV